MPQRGCNLFENSELYPGCVEHRGFIMKKICIYIDGANFYGGISSINPKYSDTKFDFEKYFNSISRGIVFQNNY